jgi:hypothetical protein
LEAFGQQKLPFNAVFEDWRRAAFGAHLLAPRGGLIRIPVVLSLNASVATFDFRAPSLSSIGRLSGREPAEALGANPRQGRFHADMLDG